MSENIIKDLSSNHKFRTEIPNILFNIGLDAHHLAVYMAFKLSAGDHSHCTKSNKHLCQNAGVSRPTLTKCRDDLSLINPILGKPLLKVVHRLSEAGDKDTNDVTIVDIWPENYKFFTEGGRKKTDLPRKKTAPPGVGKILTEGRKKTDHKEEPFNKNPSSSSPKPEIDDEKLKRIIERVQKNELPFKEAFLRKEAKERGTKHLGKALNRYRDSYINKNVQVDNPNGLLIKIHKQFIEEDANGN